MVVPAVALPGGRNGHFPGAHRAPSVNLGTDAFSTDCMIPRRSLLVVTALVLALHALLLGVAVPAAPPLLAATRPVFNTRTIAPPPSAPVARAAQGAPAPQAAPRKRPRPAPPAASPTTQAPTAAVDAVAAQDLSQGSDDPVPPTPDAQTADHTAMEQDPVTPALTPPPEPPLAAPLNEADSTASERGSAIAITPPGAAEGTGSAQPAPVRIPAPVRLGFEVAGQSKGFQYSARAELLWQHDGQQYQARQEISVLFLGSRSQTSVGEISPLGLQPRRFGDRSRSERAAHFDFAQGQVSFSANTPSAAISPGAQDRLSVFLQLSAMLSAAPQRYPVGTRVAIPTVSARAADLWTFTVEGEETLNLPTGMVRALQLQRLPRRDYDQKAQVWLAPELDYLPVRIRITQTNGDFAELNLRSREVP